MKFIEEETFHGEIIETPEEFIEDLCERVIISRIEDKINKTS